MWWILGFSCAPVETPEPAAPVPCLQVTPGRVQFGEVAVADGPTKQTFTLTNRCADDPGDGSRTAALTVGALTLDDPTGPFAATPLVDPILPPLSSTTFDVTFAPETAATWKASVFVVSDDAAQPRTEIKLVGTGLAPILSTRPTTLDFGAIDVGCPSRRAITLQNVGNLKLGVDHVALTTSSEEITVAATLPATVLPGESIVVYVDYQAYDTVDDEATLTVFSDDPALPEVEVAVTAVGKVDGRHTDTFQQPLGPLTDILFVVDNSSDMAEEQAGLVAGLDVFVRTLQGEGVDYQIAVITTDRPTFRGDVVTVETRDPADELAGQLLAGTGGSGDEEGTQMAWEACAPGGDAEPGGAFQRDDAGLSIVVVSTEPDASASTPEFYTDAFISDTKGGDESRFRLHAIAGDVPTSACETAKPGDGYYEQTLATGGSFRSICTSDWGRTLLGLGLDLAVENRSFKLSQAPIPWTLEVRVDGTLATGFAYDADARSIVFDEGALPPAGSTVQVRYDLQAACG